MQKLSVFDVISIILLIIGGFNWGIMGFFPEINLVELIFGAGVARLIYVLVGLAALYVLWLQTQLERK